MNLYQPSKGIFEISLVNSVTGKRRSVEVGHNIVVYEGIDLLGELLVGTGTAINAMYMEFQNGGTTPTVDPDPAEGRSYYAALDTGLSSRDYLRIVMSSTPTLSSTDPSKYTSNKATFYAMSGGQTVGAGGHPFTAAAQSTVYGVALVAAADIDDPSQDMVFSRSYNFTPKQKQVNEEISIQWAQIFDEAMLSSS
jgi:hypothetical protein